MNLNSAIYMPYLIIATQNLKHTIVQFTVVLPQMSIKHTITHMYNFFETKNFESAVLLTQSVHYRIDLCNLSTIIIDKELPKHVSCIDISDWYHHLFSLFSAQLSLWLCSSSDKKTWQNQSCFNTPDSTANGFKKIVIKLWFARIL